MKASKFTEAQNAFILKQGEEGTPVAEISRKAGTSQATYLNWKKRYGGLLPDEMRRLKALEDENAWLKKIVADLTLDRNTVARSEHQDHRAIPDPKVELGAVHRGERGDSEPKTTVIPPARTRSPGTASPPEPWRETTPCVRPNTLTGRSGDDGADTTAGAASRQRCIV